MDKNIELKVKQLKDACNDIARLINHQLFEDCREWFWIGDEIGDLCCFDDNDILGLADMIRILENEVTYEQYSEWRNAIHDFNINKKPEEMKFINLKSWLIGARYEIVYGCKEEGK